MVNQMQYLVKRAEANVDDVAQVYNDMTNTIANLFAVSHFYIMITKFKEIILVKLLLFVKQGVSKSIQSSQYLNSDLANAGLNN
jgi:hypothetical protein